MHESIYQALYAPQVNGLTRKMTRHLRTGRRGRLSHRTNTARRSRFSGPLLSERPAEVNNRLVPGHWEGGLVCGAFNRSAIATLPATTSCSSTSMANMMLSPCANGSATQCQLCHRI